MQGCLNYLYERILPMFEKMLEARVAQRKTLCNLEKALFKKDNIPDYANVDHVMLYLMRYGAAYLSEYYLAFKKILDTDYLEKSSLSILTVGSGANLDGLAACLAIKYSGEKRWLEYLGIEKATWPIIANWPILLTDKRRFSIIPKNVAEVTASDIHPQKLLNVISFPKVISEIEPQTIIDFLEKCVLDHLAPNFFVIFSNRNANNPKARQKDLNKALQIVDYLQKSIVNVDLKRKFHLSGGTEKNKGRYLQDLAALPLGMHPVNYEAIALCNDLGQYCFNAKSCPNRLPFVKEGSLTTVCRENIGRHPINSTKYFDTHLFYMERKR